MAKKRRADTREEGEEIYYDAIRDERWAEESSGIEEKRELRKKVERSDNVRILDVLGLMKPTVNEENLGREGSGNIFFNNLLFFNF